MESNNIESKIEAARAYVAYFMATREESSVHTFGVLDDYRNDAANIYCNSYEEYMAIWDALEGKTR